MDQNYLLTYLNKDNIPTFEWFETEDEIKEFASNDNIVSKVIDMLYVKDCEDIDALK